MSESAFGVDHGFEISKKQKDPTTGRVLTGAIVPGWHGAFAGKKGHYRKLKAAGMEAGGSMVGAAAGSALLGPGAGLAGSMTGGALGTTYAHKKGWLKDQKVSKDYNGDPFEIEKGLKDFAGGGLKAFGGAAKIKGLLKPYSGADMRVSNGLKQIGAYKGGTPSGKPSRALSNAKRQNFGPNGYGRTA